MAVNSTKVQSTMVIKFKAGTDINGNDIFKNQRFSKVKVTADDESILNVGTQLGTLLKYPLVEVIREDQNLVEAAE
ncbi:DUF1659 domain-containing protein [Clostridium sp. SYSU_GA19001]|uniref:DUF1659 domain-containing protein n=1 Tax=Clostridium caldaquaticum TaxID=2940653 RepID=UPI0020779AFE|nr:DUF1659 domain-containing protein [Clostridium caldaquaticum]MCM8709592.1 DUF1659 domain-containing protein [Clostridium caldaquaticum]